MTTVESIVTGITQSNVLVAHHLLVCRSSHQIVFLYHLMREITSVVCLIDVLIQLHKLLHFISLVCYITWLYMYTACTVFPLKNIL